MKTKRNLVTSKGRVMNELTLQAGGATLQVTYQDGTVDKFRNIKSPRSYVRTILKKSEKKILLVNNITDNRIEYDIKIHNGRL
jgi:hypothetical protein